MRKGKLPKEGRLEIEAVALARDAIPSDKELERKHGVSRAYIWKLMKAVREKAKSVGKPVPTQIPQPAMIPTPQVSDRSACLSPTNSVITAASPGLVGRKP